MKFFRLIFLSFLVIVGGSFYNSFRPTDVADSAEPGKLFKSLPDAGAIKATLEDDSRNISTFYFETNNIAIKDIRDFLGVFDSPGYSIVKLGKAYYVIYLPHFTEETSEAKHLLLVAGESRESKAFLIEYPDTDVFADKEAGMAEYREMKKNQPVQRAVPPYLRLQVFINSDDGAITRELIECWDGKKRVVKRDKEVLGYLKSGKCLL